MRARLISMRSRLADINQYLISHCRQLTTCAIVVKKHMTTSMPANKRLSQPHHAYNVFFTLERLRLIDKKTTVDATSGKVVQTPSQQQISYDLDGYESLALPDLPPRYQHLQLPMGWFVPGKNSKRKHSQSKEREFDDSSCVTLLSHATII